MDGMIKCDNDINELQIEITNKCNFSCVHCYLGDIKRVAELPVAAITQIVNEAVDLNVQKVVFSGGEPFLYSDVVKVIDLCSKLSDVHFVFATNGTCFTQEILDLIELSKNISVQISVDGYSKNIYERQRGNGTYNKFIAGYRALSERAINKLTRTCITKYNYFEVEDIYTDAINHGYKPTFLFVVDKGRANHEWDNLSLTVDEKIYVYHIIKKLDMLYGINTTLSVCGGSCFLSEKLSPKVISINVDGNCFCCEQLNDYVVSNIYEKPLRYFFDSPVLANLYEMASNRKVAMQRISSCRNCNIFDICESGCPRKDLFNNIQKYEGSQCKEQKAMILYDYLLSTLNK